MLETLPACDDSDHDDDIVNHGEEASPPNEPEDPDDDHLDPLVLEQWLEEVMAEDDMFDEFDGDGAAEVGPDDVDADGLEVPDDEHPHIAADMIARAGEAGVADAPAPMIDASPLPEYILQQLERTARDGRGELEFVLGRSAACSANPIQDKDWRVTTSELINKNIEHYITSLFSWSLLFSQCVLYVQFCFEATILYIWGSIAKLCVPRGWWFGDGGGYGWGWCVLGVLDHSS